MSCKKLLEKTKQKYELAGGFELEINAWDTSGANPKLIISVTKFRLEICPETNLYMIFVKRFFLFFAFFNSKKQSTIVK